MSKTPGLNLPYGIDPVNPIPVDSRYGPYASVVEATSSIPESLRYSGLAVMIIGLGEYWWPIGLSDVELIPKTFGGSDANYVHVQTIPATEWIVNHNLEKRCSIQVYTLDGPDLVLLMAEVVSNSINQSTIKMNGAMTGLVFCN